jgi:hypothetical protein
MHLTITLTDCVVVFFWKKIVGSMSLSISSELKRDLSSINNLPDSKSEAAIGLLKRALQGLLQDSDVVDGAEELGIELTELRTSIDALNFFISELVRVSLPKEVGISYPYFDSISSRVLCTWLVAI